MDDDKNSETSGVENDDVGEDKPRLEPTGGDEQTVEENKKDEENDEEKADDNEGLDGLAIFAQQLNDRDRLVLYEKAVRYWFMYFLKIILLHYQDIKMK